MLFYRCFSCVYSVFCFFRFPSSSMVFGTNALITKPAQSLAPMITVAILNRHNYDRLKLATTSEILNSPEYSSLLNAMFLTTCATPVIIGCLQLVIWSFYTIRSSHLTIAKHVESWINYVLYLYIQNFVLYINGYSVLVTIMISNIKLGSAS